MKKLLLLLLPLTVFAQDTTINYKGQPPPTAMAPSLSAMGTDICAVPVSGAVSSTVIGVSGGTVITDANCERLKIAKTLNDLGLKVTAVAVLCADIRVWDAMTESGSPCPTLGLIGDAAQNEWIRRHPERFKKLYGQVPAPTVAATGDK